MSDCRFGVSPVNYPDPDPDRVVNFRLTLLNFDQVMTFAMFGIEILKARYL